MGNNVAYLNVEMRANTQNLNTNIQRSNQQLDKHSRIAKRAKAANESMFQGFSRTANSVGSLNGSLGVTPGMLGGVATGLGVVTAAAAAAVLAIDSIARQNAALGRELEAQAVASNLTVQAIQEIGYATESVGIGAQKAADIFKDWQDKLGDFRSTGGGEFKDFFEQVGSKVGLTADELARMAGPDALIAVKKAMDDANVSADRQIFYLESLADDASKLSPLLANNGERFREMVESYREMDVALTNSQIERFKEYDQDIRELAAAWDSLSRDAVMPFVGLLSEAAQGMADLFNTSRTERLGNISEEIDELNSEILDLQENGKKFGGGITGWMDAMLGNVATKGERIAERQAQIRLLIREQEELQQRISSGSSGSLVNNYVPPSRASVGRSSVVSDAQKESVSRAKSRSSKKDSLYNRLFDKPDEKKNYKQNREFESSAKAAARLIEDGFAGGAKRFLAEAEASYRASKRLGDSYDVAGMKDVILMLREQAGLKYEDIDSPARKKSKDGGTSKLLVEFPDSERKTIELMAKSSAEMAEKVGEYLGYQTKVLKEASEGQRPAKKFVLELAVPGKGKKFSINAESKEDFDNQFADLLEGAAAGL